MAELRAIGTDAPVDKDTLPTFDDFWTLYPKRVARKDAAAAWARIPAKDYPMILEALLQWRRIWLKRGELEFVPHGATWLNGERYFDELPVLPTVSAACHVHAVLPTSEARGVMPENVRAELAKIRRK